MSFSQKIINASSNDPHHAKIEGYGFYDSKGTLKRIPKEILSQYVAYLNTLSRGADPGNHLLERLNDPKIPRCARGYEYEQ